jgi:2-aminoethylphosphonate-pyruvate transaminase
VILLNPGPVTLSPRVRRALAGGEDLCHREPEFYALTTQILRSLEVVHDAAGYRAVMLTGSGTCAVEAMVSTFASRSRPTLIVANGVYGERMAEMLVRQGKPARTVRAAWASAIDLAAVEQALDGVARVAVVHHETTTGRLNALEPLAELCRKRGAGLLIDAVSSFGAEEIAFQRWRPLAVAAAANKCLHGVPGIAFVLAQPDALATSEATSLYLDLAAYAKEQARGISPFTQAVQALQALREALAEFAEEGGWRARRSLYLSRSARVRGCLAKLGVEPLIPLEESASMLTAFRLPPGASYARIHDALKARGFIIYAGQGEFAERIFRIATMGAISEADLERLEAALRGAFAPARVP